MNEGFEVLIRGLKERKLFDSINIVVVSDHGMVDIQKTIYLSDYMDVKDIDFFHEGPFTMIRISQGSSYDHFHESLLNVSIESGGFFVYPKLALPRKYRHYASSKRVADFLLVCKVGYYLSIYRDMNPYIPVASHGYWPTEESMKSFFLIRSPKILKRHQLSTPLREFSSVEIYPFVLNLMGCKGLPGNWTNYLSDALLEGENFG